MGERRELSQRTVKAFVAKEDGEFLYMQGKKITCVHIRRKKKIHSSTDMSNF